MPSIWAISLQPRGVVMALTSVNVCSMAACSRAEASTMSAMVGSVSTSLTRKSEKTGSVMPPVLASPCCV